MIRLRSPHPARLQDERTGPWAGFTLVELMVASSLALALLGSAYFCLVTGQQSGDMVEKRLDLLQNARVALQFLVQDLREACPLDERFSLVGLDRVKDGLEADNIDFATHHWTPERPGEGDLCEVSWFVDRDPATGDLALLRRRDPTPDEKPLEGGYREVMAPGLRGFKLEYHDGFGWEDRWGTALEEDENQPVERPEGEETDTRYRSGLPRAVRITLVVATPSESGAAKSGTSAAELEPPLVLRTVVRLPLASRPRAEGQAAGAPAPAGASGENAPAGAGNATPPEEGR